MGNANFIRIEEPDITPGIQPAAGYVGQGFVEAGNGFVQVADNFLIPNQQWCHQQNGRSWAILNKNDFIVCSYLPGSKITNSPTRRSRNVDKTKKGKEQTTQPQKKEL